MIPITNKLFYGFYQKIKIDKESGCWIWTGSKYSYGYGKLSEGNFSAHRVSWEIHYGENPGKLFVCHHCDNPPCVNPTHLFLGTHDDNMKDMFQKGRQPIRKDKFCNKPVAKYSLDGKFLASYESIKIAAIENDCRVTSISSCCLGKLGRAGRFQWKFYTDRSEDIEAYVRSNNRKSDKNKKSAEVIKRCLFCNNEYKTCTIASNRSKFCHRNCKAKYHRKAMKVPFHERNGAS